MLIIDTHTHAGPNWFEPIELLVYQMELNGVSKALLVQHGMPEFGHYDHSYLYDCRKRFPGKFALAVIVDTTSLDPLGDLERHRVEGAVGVRLTPDSRTLGEDKLSLWRKADELGMFITCMGSVEQFASDEFASVVSEFPDMPIIMEHLAGGGESSAFPLNGPGPSHPYEKFKKALTLSDYPNVYIKIHGLGEIVNRPNVLPQDFGLDFFDDVPPLVEMAKDSFGVERIMWGSDYPPVSGREGYRNSLKGARENPVFTTPEEIEWVLGKSALKVINFD